MGEQVVQSEAGLDTGQQGGKYVYCIIRLDRARDFGEIGIGGQQRVYTVLHEDLAADWSALSLAC